jgi:anti-sigma B factor antagonist
MDLTVTKHEGYILAKPAGPLGEDSRDAFRQQLHPLVATGGTNLLIDLSDSQRINSAGVGSLVALVADANTHDSRVLLFSPPSFVAVVFNVTRLNTYFEIAANLDEALERLNSTKAADPAGSS